jgi:hypothetical protein
MDFQKVLKNEYDEIFNNNWNFLNNTYKSNIKKQYNRSKIENYINIQKVKSHVYDCLGAIPVFIFLTEICSRIKLPSPINNIEKGILVLELLLNGFSISEMKVYEDGDSFYKVYKAIFIDNIDLLENWIDDLMSKCFSNSTTRLIYSKIYNPMNFEHCTLLLDGRTNKITIEDIDLKKSDLYSYKIKKNGLNTQFILDSAGFIVFLSKSLPCKFNNDDNMFINNINLSNFFKLTDCLCFDGLYENVIDEVITKYSNIGLDISENNFCFPIRKKKNTSLEPDELDFNEQLGSYRSGIEAFFGNFANTFKRFGPRANVRITKERTFNVQLKLASLLYNIKHFVILNNIEEKQYYKLWLDENFDFFNNLSSFNNMTSPPKTRYKKENINNIRSIQEDTLNKILSECNLKAISKKNKMIVDENEDKNINDRELYEIQYIIQHRKVNNKYEYEVKWRNYKKSYNSWVHEDDFKKDSDMIENYWNTIKKN